MASSSHDLPNDKDYVEVSEAELAQVRVSVFTPCSSLSVDELWPETTPQIVILRILAPRPFCIVALLGITVFHRQGGFQPGSGNGDFPCCLLSAFLDPCQD
jgi:hypothetical protein